MYAFIEGKVCEKSGGTLILQAGGVGYLLTCSLTTIQAAPPVGQTMRCLTYFSVREDAMELVGFATQEEKDLFLRLIAVSGVGPKLALAILSGLTVGDLQLAIAEGNAKRLAAVKGIGKKTAERIVVELKDKVNPIEALAHGKAAAGDAAKGAVLRDAMLALTALGFSEDTARAQVERVLEADPAVADTETLIRRALAGK